jgi:hypothetical protein
MPPNRMILFYSNFCPHCRMLLDTIERHDTQRMIKVVSIEALRSKGQTVPPQITSVPALILLPSKNILMGKNVFDYLLLPGKGKLLTSVGTTPSNDGTAPVQSQPSEPMAYSIGGMTSRLSDAFSSIEDSEQPMQGHHDRAYAWTTLEQTPLDVSVSSSTPFQEETRTKKHLPDLDAIKSQRDMELTQNDINTTQLLPPTPTR